MCEAVTSDVSDAVQAAVTLSQVATDAIRSAFERSSAEGLLLLAGPSVRETLPAEFLFWREWARRFFQAVCQLDEERLAEFANSKNTKAGEPPALRIAPPDNLALAVLIAEAPPMRGLEYLTPDVLKALWFELAELVRRRGTETDGGLAAFLREVNPFWHLLGRVTFHLAENKRDESRPFAFLATYSHRMSAQASVQHLPLAQALKQYAGERDQAKLAELLAPVRAAADGSEIVDDLAKQLKQMKEHDKSDGIQRRGIVLATMMRLKQVCNHPSQYLAQPEFAPDDSGKFARLAAICEPIAERQEKMLVFTQFQSICEPLAKYLGEVFGRPGLVLHGGIPVGKRKELVRRFQEEDAIPFFVISVKAGGTGLNLTAASHVVHFDRWWNPAVENQATDRAFRIGQKRNVLVHKFVCRGTLEERIDQMIRDKQDLADEVLGQSREGETLLTEMTDRELLKFVALDITRAAEE